MFEVLQVLECTLSERLKVKGFLMKNINSGSGKENIWLKKNMVYFYVNKRKIHPQYVLSEVYRQFNPNSKFIAILNFEVKNE